MTHLGQTTYYALPIEENFKQTPVTKTLSSRPSSLDGYTPINKKLLQYPYCYLGFTVDNGSQNLYRYEDFANGTPVFKIISEINPNPSILFIPQNYRGVSGDNLQDKANLTGFPTISYKNDYFNTWLAQNGQIINLNMQQEKFNTEIAITKETINGISGITENALKTNVIGGLKAGADLGINMSQIAGNYDFYIKQQMAQVEKQKLMPDQANLSSSNATAIGYALNDNSIFTTFTIKRQFAERIDKYFSMFGYLTNTVKLPNINNRPNWNYVKTIGANIEGNIPQNDLNTIKEMFNLGITLWHNTNTFLDYSQNNR